MRFQIREPHTVVGDSISGDDPQRAGIGDDEHPLPVRQGLLGYGPGQAEHVLVVPGPDDARLAEGSAEDLIIPGQRGGMGGHSLLTCVGSTGLEDDYGLVFSYAPGHIYESAASLHRLQIHADDIDVLVLAHCFQYIGLIYVQLIADGGNDPEVHDMPQAPEHSRRAYPCLRDQADVAHGQSVHYAYGLDHAAVGVDDAGAVGAQKTHAITIGDLLHRQLYLLALIAQFSKAGRLHHNVAYPALAALLHHIRSHPCRYQDYGHIHRLRNGADAGIGLVPADLIGPGVDGIELSPELVADQIGEDIPA